MKDWDFGYFGKGIDGYVHYMQAFHCNFPNESQPTQPVKHSSTSGKKGTTLDWGGWKIAGISLLVDAVLVWIVSLLR